MMNPLLVALDLASASEAVRLATRLAGVVGGFKVGLELLMGPGPASIAAIRELGLPVMVDAKLHDIPNTVEAAARQLGRLGARWVTVHGGGGVAMLEAARRGLESGAEGRPAGIIVVTVLTSLNGAALSAVGVAASPGKQVARLARLASEAGMEGVVCSVGELGDVAQVGPELIKIVPGIRPSGSEHSDQARVGTPAEAMQRGADYIVVGRPIIKAADPVKAAAALVSGLEVRTEP
jgi:orotidine-5'-phosphate decarboxylase